MRSGGTFVSWLAVGLTALAFEPSSPGPAGRDPGAAVLRGRQVYIAEGCIHCHSQYLRPGTGDLDLWGPAAGVDDLSAGARPLLYGNRRQGPDLSTVGARRSSTWQRLHLQNPRVLRPGSRMPSYAHLFADPRGADLVAYLDSLGATVRDERWRHTRQLALDAVGGVAERGRRTFERECSACHGRDGRGDGPLAATVYRPAMDLRKGRFWLVSWGPDTEDETTALARLIRYGMPGTDMPGHETLGRDELADLVAHVRALASAAKPPAADAGAVADDDPWGAS